MADANFNKTKSYIEKYKQQIFYKNYDKSQDETKDINICFW